MGQHASIYLYYYILSNPITPSHESENPMDSRAYPCYNVCLSNDCLVYLFLKKKPMRINKV